MSGPVSEALSDFNKMQPLPRHKIPSTKPKTTAYDKIFQQVLMDEGYFENCIREHILNMPIGRILGQCSTTTPLNQPAWTVQVLRPSHSASQSAFQILWNQYLRVTSLKRQLFCSAAASSLALLDELLAVRARCWKMTTGYIIPGKIAKSRVDMAWIGSRGIDQSNGCHGTILAWMSVQSMRLIYQGSRWPTQAVPYSIEWRLDFKRNRTTAKKRWVGSCPMEEKAACDCCSPSVLNTQHSMTMLKPFAQDSIPSLLEGILSTRIQCIVYCGQPSSTCAYMVQPRLGFRSPWSAS